MMKYLYLALEYIELLERSSNHQAIHSGTVAVEVLLGEEKALWIVGGRSGQEMRKHCWPHL